MSFIIWRLSHSSDRKKIEEFIDKTHADFRSGTIDCEQGGLQIEVQQTSNYRMSSWINIIIISALLSVTFFSII